MRELILDPYLRIAAMNCLMDGVLLWTAGAVIRRAVRWRRLLLGAAFGGLYTFFLALAKDGFIRGWAWMSSPLVLLVLVPVIMLLLAYLPAKPRVLFRLAGSFFFLALLTYGLANAFLELLKLRAQAFSPFFLVLLEVGLTLAVGEIGWGVVHRRAVAGLCRIPMAVKIGPIELTLYGYLDTGNHLRDPLTQRPVVVLDYAAIREHLSVEARTFIESIGRGGNLEELPADDPWTTRIRVIPYRSVQKEAGLMPGLRTDLVRLGRGGEGRSFGSLVVGLDLSGGLGDDDCRALVPPGLWSEDLTGKGLMPSCCRR